MFKNKNKLGFLLLFFALFGFVFLSVGGEFLHSQIHHHNTQASHDQCALYVFQVQLFIALLAVIAAVSRRIQRYVVNAVQVLSSQSQINLPYLRAPPVSL